MRTQEDKEKILDRYKPSKYLVGEVSPSMIEYLLEHFRGSEKIIKYKEAGSKGPVVMNYSPDRDEKQEWFNPVQELVWDILGSNCYVWGSNIFRVEKPPDILPENLQNLFSSLRATTFFSAFESSTFATRKLDQMMSASISCSWRTQT